MKEGILTKLTSILKVLYQLIDSDTCLHHFRHTCSSWLQKPPATQNPFAQDQGPQRRRRTSKSVTGATHHTTTNAEALKALKRDLVGSGRTRVFLPPIPSRPVPNFGAPKKTPRLCPPKHRFSHSSWSVTHPNYSPPAPLVCHEFRTSTGL